MYRMTLPCFFLAWLLSSSVVAAAPLSVAVEAEAVILMNADSGVILYEKSAHVKHHPASITKIATALFALQVARDRLNDRVTISSHSLAIMDEEEKALRKYQLPPYLLEPDGKSWRLQAGEQTTLRDLLYLTLVVSANDAANALAEAVAGSIPLFVEGLNAMAALLACRNTTFYNPHGFYYPGHMTTAYDMALISKEALKDPLFCEIAMIPSYTRAKTNKQEPNTFENSNKLVVPGKHFDPRSIGVKRGYIWRAQHTIVAAAKEGGRTLIAVLLYCPERDTLFDEATKLFDAAFAERQQRRIAIAAGEQLFACKAYGASAPLTTYTEEPLVYTYYPAEEQEVKAFLVWNEGLAAPLQQGQYVGELRLATTDGTSLHTVPLLARNAVDKALWARIVGQSTPALLLDAALIGAIVLLLSSFAYQMRRH